MLKSKIEIKNGNPCLYVDSQPTTAMAYTTYFPERNCYQDFIDSGYRIFFMNVSFTTLPINPDTEFSPFHVGVFEDPKNPDYSEFEEYIHGILRACPDAIIFPRINVSMPKWWIDTHPDDVYLTDKGAFREAMFSEAFRSDGAKMLIELVRHIKNSDYAYRVGGWMLCGGATQEWIYRNYTGDLGSAAQEPYKRWIKENYGIDNAVLPSREDYNYIGKVWQESENAKRYSTFCNLEMAKSLDIFAEVIKKETNFEQVVGAFYGYTFEAKTALFGLYALRTLVDSPNLDFFSSPNAYTNARAFGMDWADMMPVDSLKEHGKLCFIECDIRTYLTKSIQEARPGEYPDGIYRTKNGISVWAGPPTAELSRAALRKSFAHQITKASAIWWFDMWGGWYDDPLLMKELSEMKKIYDNDLFSNRSKVLSPDVVFFADEQSYANMLTGSPHIGSIKVTRTAMGKTGVPYDSCMVEDAERILQNYKAAVFPFSLPSEAGKHAMELCEKMGIPYLSTTKDHYELTVDEIREFYKANEIHFYTDEKDVVYVGNGYIGLHSAVGETKRLHLPRTCTVSPIFGAEFPTQTTDCIEFELKENATALFSVSQ
ncbi:MAG: hypothetical protein IJ011_02115 [Clostridia bacterium]|nr:hypothetical protein [Clostridia bacterium]